MHPYPRGGTEILRILTDDPDGFADGQHKLTAPNGTRIEIDELNPQLVMRQTDYAIFIPPDMKTRYSNPSGDLEILEVSLLGIFDTKPE